MQGRVGRIEVRAVAGTQSRGRVMVAGLNIPCALGSGGISRLKREGDGCTPAGRFAFCGGFIRRDRMIRLAPWLVPTRPHWGWCDAPESPRYNRRVDLPCPAAHELLWREDNVYDAVIVLNYNLAPRRRGRGSAIFFHLARKNFSPTAGCVAISAQNMRRLVPRLSETCVMVIK
jgi:L,D-peptidoglycan transpeptidase YkuD (ErfK/YbiS/YcfS/YnhG family)